VFIALAAVSGLAALGAACLFFLGATASAKLPAQKRNPG